MIDIPLGILFAILAVLISLSAFFSGSETGLMALNRYRLRHLAKKGDRAAQRVSKLLERPDRLIGIILLGNNFFNILATSLTTLIAIRLLGDAGIALAALVLTVVLLIFGEVAPKTLAALHPDRIAFPASFVLGPLLKLFYPLVWVINSVANALLKLFGVTSADPAEQPLSPEELRTVVMEAGVMIPKRHQNMLLSILDLEEVTVNDIMVPRNELKGIDLQDSRDNMIQQLTTSPFSRLLVYRENIDQIVGFLDLREVVNPMLQEPDFGANHLNDLIREPYFIPEGTSLNQQLLNFQQQHRHTGLVVDEYGDILGLVTVEDILEEIVGEFTSDPLAVSKKVLPQADGSFMVDGGTPVRALNRMLNWDLPTDGPKTLSGLIMEHLETIPEPGARFSLEQHPVEIVKITGNRIKTVLMRSAAEDISVTQ